MLPAVLEEGRHRVREELEGVEEAEEEGDVVGVVVRVVRVGLQRGELLNDLLVADMLNVELNLGGQ